MGFIDCDAHIIESSETWSYLDPDEAGYRPRRVEFLDKRISFDPSVRAERIWVAGDAWTTNLPSDSNQRGNANLFEAASTHLEDPAARLADLDALGIDAQIVISSFFIGVELDNPLAEAALARSYNRWLAERTAGYTDRLPWTMRPPLRMLDRTFSEMEFAREHGAVGLHVRGIEHGMFLSDPYFFPVYERAQDLDMAIIVHLGEAGRRVDNQEIGRLIFSPAAFDGHAHKLMAGFHAVIASDLYRRFPRLRWGFVEGGASWAPAVLQLHSRLDSSRGGFLKTHKMTPAELEERNVFIACFSEEDLPYLTEVLGENVLVVGTDYAHNDAGAELGAHTVVANDPRLEPSVARKIVDDNGRKLFGISRTFTPANQPGRPVAVPHVHGLGEAGAPVLYASSAAV